MYFARWSTLLVAALIASPALYHAFVVADLAYGDALIRFLIAVPVAAIMLSLLRGLAAGYRRGAGMPGRRRSDADVPLPPGLEPDEIV